MDHKAQPMLSALRDNRPNSSGQELDDEERFQFKD